MNYPGEKPCLRVMIELFRSQETRIFALSNRGRNLLWLNLASIAGMICLRIALSLPEAVFWVGLAIPIIGILLSLVLWDMKGWQVWVRPDILVKEGGSDDYLHRVDAAAQLLVDIKAAYDKNECGCKIWRGVSAVVFNFTALSIILFLAATFFAMLVRSV